MSLLLPSINQLKTQKILLLGMGVENQAFLKWLVADLQISLQQIWLLDAKNNLGGDLKTYFEFFLNLNSFTELENWLKTNLYFGPDYLEKLEVIQPDLIVKAPGIWSLLPQLENFRKNYGEHKIISGLAFFLEKYGGQTIAITGTKGKSTTSSLINFLLTKSGVKNYYLGNTVGISPYEYWSEFENNPDLIAVLEVSSFQLQDLGYSKLSPATSVITNLYLDHLDQHASKEEYWYSKANIFNYQKMGDKIIVNSQVLEKLPDLAENKNCLSIDELLVAQISQNIQTNLPGFHNQQNLSLALFAVENLLQKANDLTTILNSILTKKDFYNQALEAFQALEHRLQKVLSFKKELVLNSKNLDLEINFYDDGAATEPDAVVCALESLTQGFNELVWLFLAGKDKGVDLENLIQTLKKKQNQLLKVQYCGEIGQKIYQQTWGKKIELTSFKKTTEAFTSNFEQELKNNLSLKLTDLNLDLPIKINIVFSPCGSSFDEFENYKQRSIWWVKKIETISITNPNKAR